MRRVARNRWLAILSLGMLATGTFIGDVSGWPRLYGITVAIGLFVLTLWVSDQPTIPD